MATAARPPHAMSHRWHDMNTPDALFLPETWKKGETQLDRIDSILAIAEPLLNVDRVAGGTGLHPPPAWRAPVRDGRPQDTLQFPVGHPREGKPRYHWIEQPDGSEHGFLVEEARHA